MIKLPKDYNGIAEQLIRPTGLIDPLLYLRPSEAVKKQNLIESMNSYKLTDLADELSKYDASNQIDDLQKEIKNTIKKGQRVLVTTLTKRMAEDLTSYLQELGIKVQYLHSEIDTVERVDILRDLRLGTHDVVVGINLLREGLDLPEVSLVTILDADKEGFLRSTTSLLQTIGRAARHEQGKVILYADKITDSMANAIRETERRRALQIAYNKKHGITPKGIKKEIRDQLIRVDSEEERNKLPNTLEKRVEQYKTMNPKQKKELIKELEIQMTMYADMLEFEKAAEVRDMIDGLK